MMQVKLRIAQSQVRLKRLQFKTAASLKGALTELADAYKKEHNLADDQITINFAGSGTLRQQIEQGAPASLFILQTKKI